jgi:hypothetical protein
LTIVLIVWEVLSSTLKHEQQRPSYMFSSELVLSACGLLKTWWSRIPLCAVVDRGGGGAEVLLQLAKELAEEKQQPECVLSAGLANEKLKLKFLSPLPV